MEQRKGDKPDRPQLTIPTGWKRTNLHDICRTSLVPTCHVTTVRATCELVSHMPHVGDDTGTHLPYMAPVLSSAHRKLFSLPKGLPKRQVSNDKQHEASACDCEKQKLLLSVLKPQEGDAKSEIRYKATAHRGFPSPHIQTSLSVQLRTFWTWYQ